MALFTLDFRSPSVDVGAFADHPGEEVFVGQLSVGVGNGLARNAQLLGQQATGWQLRPRRQTPGLDGAAQLVVQLTCQVLAAIDDNMQFHTGEAPGQLRRVCVAQDYPHPPVMQKLRGAKPSIGLEAGGPRIFRQIGPVTHG